ncbi:hypothetical protein ACFV7R_38740 [Streptomyces sp. NPDC059866]|uniref:hypothetical protein n=1 Tax=Streptomyces sp. NPDC059866 TaxID=3346978 RepID=UPI00365277F6
MRSTSGPWSARHIQPSAAYWPTGRADVVGLSPVSGGAAQEPLVEQFLRIAREQGHQAKGPLSEACAWMS